MAKALEDEACVLQAVLQAEEGFFLVELEVGNFITLALDGYIITVNVLHAVYRWCCVHQGSQK